MLLISEIWDIPLSSKVLLGMLEVGMQFGAPLGTCFLEQKADYTNH